MVVLKGWVPAESAGLCTGAESCAGRITESIPTVVKGKTEPIISISEGGFFQVICNVACGPKEANLA